MKGSGWLMHEAFCLYRDAEEFKPYEKHHSTVREACQTAEELKIPNLILYHTEEKNLKDRKKLYIEEGNIIAAICMCRMIWKCLNCSVIVHGQCH